MVQPPSRPEARRRLGCQTANELGAPVASSIPAQLPGHEPASARMGYEDGHSLFLRYRRVEGPRSPLLRCRPAGNLAWTDSRAAFIHSMRGALATHSITSSARASSVGGTAMRSILAVSALMTSSNLLACTTGRSAGLVPLRMRPV